MAKAQQNGLVTATVFAAAMGVNRRTVGKWLADGLPIVVRGKGGRPNLLDMKTGAAWVAAMRSARPDNGTAGLIAARTEREAAGARLAEQAYATRQRDLLPRDEVEKVWAAEVAAVRSALLAIPDQHAEGLGRAYELSGLDGLRRALRDAIYSVLRELANPDRPIGEGA